MAKRRRKGRRPSPPGRGAARSIPSPPAAPFRDRLTVFVLGLVLVATALAVDPSAHASFDAPKRLAALLGIALAAVFAFGFRFGALGNDELPSPREWWSRQPTEARLAVGAAAFGLLWAAVAAVSSPRRSLSLDSLRALALFAVLLPLGASAAVERAGRPLLAVFLAAGAVNAGISVAQSRGFRLFRLETVGARDETGALAGNVGYLATLLAMAAVAALAVVIAGRRPLARGFAAGALLLFLLSLLVSRNLTSLLGIAAGTIALVVALRGRRGLAPLAAALGILAVGAIAYPPARARILEAVRVARSGDWDRLTTYRGGAWAAAIEMTRDRPLVGYGPGTYGAEFTPHRLEAEMRAGRRFVNPLVTSSYSEAHCDYLQAFAETGIPGGLAAIVASGALLAGLRRRTGASEPRLEPAILFAVLTTAAVTALAWFPMQRSISAVPLLLAAGRGWRIVSGGPEEAEP